MYIYIFPFDLRTHSQHPVFFLINIATTVTSTISGSGDGGGGDGDGDGDGGSGGNGGGGGVFLYAFGFCSFYRIIFARNFTFSNFVIQSEASEASNLFFI